MVKRRCYAIVFQNYYHSNSGIVYQRLCDYPISAVFSSYDSARLYLYNIFLRAENPSDSSYVRDFKGDSLSLISNGRVLTKYLIQELELF